MSRMVDARRAVEMIRPGSRVWLGAGCATPMRLMAALEERAPADIEYLSYLATSVTSGRAGYRHRTFLVTSGMEAAVAAGRVDYVPMSLAEVPVLLATGRLKVDVALLQVSPPDARGFVSLGIAVDLAPAILATGCLAIAEVTPAMPRTHGDSFVPADRFAAMIETTDPIAEYIHPPTGERAPRIARYIAAMIDDGATLHLGPGRWPAETMKYLGDRRHLGMHSDVLTDGIVDLVESGALTGARKSRDRYRIVGSTAFGTQRLYDFLHDNPGIAMAPIDRTADPELIAAQHAMVSVGQAFAIDLTGQACVDQLDGKLYGGVSNLAAFMRGAARSPHGKAILCLASRGRDGASAIRPRLRPDEAVGIARSDVHFVVTEWGIAHLFGRSIRERALALIEIAHPDDREALLREAIAIGHLGAGQRLASQRDYPVEEERRITLADGRTVLLRPTRAGDAPALQALFHRLREEDRYTRFFRRMKSLSLPEAEALCNVNHATEVAFLAVTGERDAELVVGSACYFVDSSTNLAEVAYMIAPEMQGQGLGRAAQAVLVDFAKRHGVRGFVADILPGNQAMRRLAMAIPGKVTVDAEPDLVRVTALFD
jgi:acyl-CoA hydrolase/L-amino acid N-acyltransferase YncA